MENKILEYYYTLNFNSQLVTEMMKSRQLMPLLQNGFGNKLPREVAKSLTKADLNEADLSYLEHCIINSDVQLDKIKPMHFPDFARQGLTYKEQWSRALKTANIGLNSAWNLIEAFDLEEHKKQQLQGDSAKVNQERIDALVTILNEKIDVLKKMTETPKKSKYRYSDLWMNNFRWAINLCGYRNRGGVTENQRRKSLEIGVFRIGNVDPIIEYLKWLVEVNEDDNRFKPAIERWRSDITWLESFDK
jgi:hypothetical protein